MTFRKQLHKLTALFTAIGIAVLAACPVLAAETPEPALVQTVCQEICSAQHRLAQAQADAQQLLSDLKGKQTKNATDDSEGTSESDELMAILPSHYDLMATGIFPAPGTSIDSDAWLYPLPAPAIITDPFGMRESHPIYGDARMHDGVDLGIDDGTEIYAARSGVVVSADYNSSAGYFVEIDHGDGYHSIYMHMERFVVEAGDRVRVGQVIGYVGETGSATGPHLHFGITWYGVYQDPMGYISWSW